MTDEPLSVTKYGASIRISPEATAELARTVEAANDAVRRLPAMLDRALNATPEQRAEWAGEREHREAEAAAERAAQRAAIVPTPLTVEALLAKMGWSREYAEHLVQPYCECGDDIDGWSYCQHAWDLGFAP